MEQSTIHKFYGLYYGENEFFNVGRGIGPHLRIQDGKVSSDDELELRMTEHCWRKLYEKLGQQTWIIEHQE